MLEQPPTSQPIELTALGREAVAYLRAQQPAPPRSRKDDGPGASAPR
jgi:hypothetical protein